MSYFSQVRTVVDLICTAEQGYSVLLELTNPVQLYSYYEVSGTYHGRRGRRVCC